MKLQVFFSGYILNQDISALHKKSVLEDIKSLRDIYYDKEGDIDSFNNFLRGFDKEENIRRLNHFLINDFKLEFKSDNETIFVVDQYDMENQVIDNEISIDKHKADIVSIEDLNYLEKSDLYLGEFDIDISNINIDYLKLLKIHNELSTTGFKINDNEISIKDLEITYVKPLYSKLYMIKNNSKGAISYELYSSTEEFFYPEVIIAKYEQNPECLVYLNKLVIDFPVVKIDLNEEQMKEYILNLFSKENIELLLGEEILDISLYIEGEDSFMDLNDFKRYKPLIGNKRVMFFIRFKDPSIINKTIFFNKMSSLSFKEPLFHYFYQNNEDKLPYKKDLVYGKMEGRVIDNILVEEENLIDFFKE